VDVLFTLGPKKVLARVLTLKKNPTSEAGILVNLGHPQSQLLKLMPNQGYEYCAAISDIERQRKYKYGFMLYYPTLLPLSPLPPLPSLTNNQNIRKSYRN
jgi:hypothetical protein